NSRFSSWGIQKSWEQFDSRNASEANFQFADGDLPKTKACGDYLSLFLVVKIYAFLLNASIVTRWIIFIIPVLILLWIPGILSLTAYPNAGIWHVRLLWWSVWFTVIWVGWWAALAFAMMIPHVLRATLGAAALSLRKYFDWLTAMRRPVALVAWSTAIWVSFNPLIYSRLTPSDANRFPSSKSSLFTVGRLAFGIMLSSIILFFEKYCIQLVAYRFHERSYADRIAEQKRILECLVILYRNSTDMNRSDTLHNPHPSQGGSSLHPGRFLKSALKGVKRTAETTTTAFGNMASEIAGSSVLQPNSPIAMVSAALASTHKSRMLARRIFYSFASPDADRLILGDFSRFFPSREMASSAFEIFDKDENGDVTRDEIEGALVEIHNERKGLAASMKDVDSATRRLNDILMSLYFLLVLLIFAIMLDASVSSLITGAGTFVLGLSWLIGGTAQEGKSIPFLSSIIFLFMKHPFDIGDNIEIDGIPYTVKEIRLLSTVLVDSRGCDVQCPSNVLNTKYIMNRRRSFSCHYSTTFEQIEDLRSRMLTFVKVERRDYLPVFDILVLDLPDQTSMLLKVEIKYKSNWQIGGLKAQRRNKWICALKNALAASKIYGPSGDPDAAVAPQQIALIPYEVAGSPGAGTETPNPLPRSDAAVTLGRTDFDFLDRSGASLPRNAGNIFGMEEGNGVRRPAPGPESGDPYRGSPQSDEGTLRARSVAAPERVMMPAVPSASLRRRRSRCSLGEGLKSIDLRLRFLCYYSARARNF
ncbi:hypothetical protein BS47DRAFT_1446349, partial [Hydnum rufescens UP504]